MRNRLRINVNSTWYSSVAYYYIGLYEFIPCVAAYVQYNIR